MILEALPELLQFVDDVIPILHGERTFAPHHYCHGDVVVGAIDICVPKPVSQVERLSFSTFLQVIANLGGTLHVKDKGLPFIVFYHLSQYLLTIAFAPKLLAHGKVPEPVDRLAWIDDGESNKVFAIVVCSEIQRHFLNQAHQVLPWDLFVFGECRFIQLFYLFISESCCYVFCCQCYPS